MEYWSDGVKEKRIEEHFVRGALRLREEGGGLASGLKARRAAPQALSQTGRSSISVC